MLTIQSIKARNIVQLKSPIRVKVCAVALPYQYGETEEKSLINLSICDATDYIKAVCFDRTKFSSFEVNAGIVLHNITQKNQQIIINQNSRVFKTASPQVDDEIFQRARQLILPPKPPTITISEAKKSPVKKQLSIRGQVVKDSIATDVLVGQKNVPVKSITIQDDTDEVNVSLWRDLANTDVTLGSYVEITHVILNEKKYQNSECLQSTQYSHIQSTWPEGTWKLLHSLHLASVVIDAKETEMPVTTTMDEILGCDIGNASSTLIAKEKGIFKVDNDILTAHFQCELQEVTTQFPVNMEITRRGQNVISLQ